MIQTATLAALVGSAAAFSPAAVPGALSQSKVAASYTAPAPIAPRAELQMSAVTERDADGNPVTHYEMLDPIYLVIAATPWIALLATNPF